MKLKFKATPNMKKYNGVHVDGSVLDVTADQAERMLRDYPDNFTEVGKKPTETLKPKKETDKWLSPKQQTSKAVNAPENNK